MNQDQKKQQAAAAALEFVGDGAVIGVGTGSTVNHFIDGLAGLRHRVAGAVSSSEASTRRLQQHGIPVLDLNATGELEVYVDGADEATREARSPGRRSSPRRRGASSASSTTRSWSHGSAGFRCRSR
jgi:ribose 5-phosphate isomerase